MPNPPARPLLIAAGLSLSPAIALGLARFAYALLLPGMRVDLAWTYAEAGALNTANAVGYLMGALSAAWLADRFGHARILLLSLIATVLSVAGCAVAEAFSLFLALRWVAGAGGAVAFVVAGGFAATLAGEAGRRAQLVLGVYFAGPGVGIVLSGVSLPLLDSAYASPAEAWRTGWLLLALLAGGGLLVLLPALARAPRPVVRPHHEKANRGLGALLPLLPVTLGYACFGTGYIAYMTFIIAYLQGAGWSPWVAALFWLTLGTASLLGALFWTPLLARLRGGKGLSVTLAATALGAGLPVVSLGAPAIFLSATAFGGAFLGVITAVMAFGRRSTPPHLWTAILGAFTVSFAIGQCLGPVISGWAADALGVRASIALSVGVLTTGVLLALLQREVAPAPERR